MGFSAGDRPPYRRMVECANVGVWVLDADGRTLFANAKACEILGYPSDEMAHVSLFDVLDEQGKAQAARNLERRRQGMTAQLECAFVRRDGSRVWVLASTSPFQDNDGAYAGAVSVMSEITERKHIEEALQQREQQLAEAQRVAHLGSWEWDLATGATTWSQELLRILGLDADARAGADEPSYERLLAHVHRDDVAMVTSWIDDALRRADGFEGDHRIVRQGGEVVWVRTRGEVLRDHSGAPVRLRATAQDITASKRAEDALDRATGRSRLLETMASAANDASSLTEVLQTAVDAICGHTGWPVGHAYVPACHDAGLLVSSGIWAVAGPEPRFAALRAVTAATSFRAGEGMVGALAVGAEPVWVEDVTLDRTHRRAMSTPSPGVRTHVAVPVRLGAETIAVLEFFSPDALPPDRDLLATLDRVGVLLGRVAERERANAELAAARDGAMESSRAKSEFLATMSHEIRTPMNAVIGLTGLLLRTELDERQRQYAEGVHGAGEALLAIINDILDFSKIEAGKVELEVVDFDVVQLVEEAAGLVAEAARRKGLELVAYCYPDLPTGLRGDPARLRQVLLNLASNAVKFTGEGEVVVRARRVDRSADAVVVRFEVTDTGVGISADDRERLFEPFSQGDASTTRRFGGTGLGLAISTQLVAAMGGEIGVDSEPGRGSTFWFTVPLGCSGPSAAGRRSSHHLLEGLRVLVVDDNETNRFILREQLGAWDMHPSLAEGAAPALQMLAAAAGAGRPYELAVLDMCRPGMDGLQLARRIVADPVLAPTQLVLLTSTSDVGPEEAREAGVAACLTKPVRLSQLYDALVRLSSGAGTEPLPPVARDEAAEARGHILVVEDNATNQMVAVGLLEALGYSADVAANGLEALAALDRAEYAAVLMDCQMPEMDGYTATRHIRRRPGGSRIPVIAMTAGAIAGDRDRCIDAGMDDYVTKPVKPAELEATLGRWAGPRGGARDAGAARREAEDGPAAGVAVDADRLELLRRVGPGDGSLLVGLIDTFVTQAPSNLADLVAAVSTGDAAALHRAAHRLKGSAANMGVVGVAAICAELEDLARAGRLARAPALVRDLEAEWDRAVRHLSGFTATMPAAGGS